MRTLTTADLRVALDNLFTSPERSGLFKTTAAHAVYGAQLDSLRVELPLTLKTKRPRAKDLQKADATHDDAGGALIQFTDSIQEHPFVDDALKAKAERLRAQFIPDASVLIAKYKKEAQAALSNRPKLAGMEADLKSIPTPDGRTAYDWVVDFLDSGDAVGSLLDARSKVEADEPEARQARASALGLLVKARSLVADEVEKNGSTLPKNADALLFGYFDTLASFRSSPAGQADDAPPPPPPPVTLAPAVPPPAGEPK